MRRCSSIPDYYVALDGMAQVQVGLGHLARRAHYERQAVDRVPLPQYVGLLGDLYRVTGRHVAAHARVRADRRDREDARGERCPQRPRHRALRRRPRHRPPRTRSPSRARATPSRPSIFGDDVLGWALARNGRCARGAALLEPVAPARHAGRAEVLPPRLDRGLSRPQRRGARVRTGARSRSTRASRSCGRPSRGREHVVKRLARPRWSSRSRCSCRSRRRRTRSATSRSTASRASRSRATACTSGTCSTWRRSRRSRRGSRASTRASTRAGSRRASTSRSTGARVALVPVAHALAFPLGVGGLHTMRLELILRGPACRAPRRVARARHELRRPHRLEGDRRRRAARRASPTSSSPIRRASCRARSTSRPRRATSRRPRTPCRGSRTARRSRRPTASPTPASRG